MRLLGQILILTSLFAVNGSVASESPADWRKKIDQFVVQQTHKHGFDKTFLEDVFSNVRYQKAVIDAISRPAEQVLEWKDYRKIFLTEQRINEGKAFIQRHKENLLQAQQEFGVPPQVVAAIIGVETFYGRYRGKYKVLDALATLAFAYPRRGKFFRSELEQFLLLTREQKFTAANVLGSYAGAMGYGQFIPSSYRHYAIDFDGDQVADLLNNEADAIGSVANYLHLHGWKKGTSVVAPANLSQNALRQIPVPRHLKLSQDIGGLLKGGVEFEYLPGTPPAARLLRLVTEKGPEYWVAFKNFYVLTRYNHSSLYAMAVYQLSVTLREESGPL